MSRPTVLGRGALGGGGYVTANIGWYVFSEKWHHFWELPKKICWAYLKLQEKVPSFRY